MSRRHDDKMALRQRLLDLIATRQRDEAMNGDLAESANAWALARGYGFVTVAEVDRIDSTSMGHVDWAEKLALRIADRCVYEMPKVES